MATNKPMNRKDFVGFTVVENPFGKKRYLPTQPDGSMLMGFPYRLGSGMQWVWIYPHERKMAAFLADRDTGKPKLYRTVWRARRVAWKAYLAKFPDWTAVS